MTKMLSIPRLIASCVLPERPFTHHHVRLTAFLHGLSFTEPQIYRHRILRCLEPNLTILCSVVVMLGAVDAGSSCGPERKFDLLLSCRRRLTALWTLL